PDRRLRTSDSGPQTLRSEAQNSRCELSLRSSGSLCRGLTNTNSFARHDGIRRIYDHRLVAVQASYDLDLTAEIVADLDWPQLYFIAMTHNRQSQPFRTKQQSVNGKREGICRDRQLHVNFSVSACEELTCRIIHRDFNEQCAGTGVDRTCGTNELALEPAIGKFSQSQICRHTGLGHLRIGLRHIDVNAKMVRLGNVKQLTARAGAGAGIDQRADIGVAGSDHTAERRINFLKRLQLFQTLHIGVRTRINGSIGEGLDIGWKNKFLRRGRTLWLNYRNRWDGHPGGFFFEVFVGLDARHDAKDDQHHRHEND